MKLSELINKYFLGNHIDDKHIGERGEILYVTSSELSEEGAIISSKDRLLRETILNTKYHFTDFLEYGDYYIVKINDDWVLYRYPGSINKKIILSSEFLVLRPTGSYFDNFLKDTDGRLYFQNAINKIGRKNTTIDQSFISQLQEIEIDQAKQLIVQSEFEIAKPDFIKSSLKRQHLDPSKITISNDKTSLLSVLKRIDRDAIDLFTEFQRNAGLWSLNAKSRLIESLLVRFPIPAFYFDCSNEQSWLVIDGLQRLSTIRDFHKDLFGLQNLEFLPHLEGLKFSELDQNLQDRIEETNITTLKIQPGTPLRVKYSLFERINTEGKPLKAQELRHAINSFDSGKPSKFIKELSELEIFKDVWDGKQKNRMQDRETCLRYVAFKIFNYLDYKPEFKEFLDESMAAIYKLSYAEMKKIKIEFGDSLVVAKQLFENRPFRVSTSDNKPIFNNPLFECIVVTLSNLTEIQRERILDMRDITSSLLTDLIRKESSFHDVILSKKSGSYESVVKRFKVVEDLFNLVLEGYD